MPYSLPNEILGDEVRLKQMILNLIKHALKSARDHPITIKVSYIEQSQSLILVVVNHGRGLKREELTRIQNFFENGEYENEIDFGLVLCKKIIDFYEGNISISSNGLEHGHSVRI